jgi:hypothetical protein
VISQISLIFTRDATAMRTYGGWSRKTPDAKH